MLVIVLTLDLKFSISSPVLALLKHVSAQFGKHPYLFANVFVGGIGCLPILPFIVSNRNAVTSLLSYCCFLC